MKIKFIVEKGGLGSDKIIVDPKILKFSNPIPLLLEFDNKISEANISLEDGILWAEADIDIEFEGFYPAIGFSIEKNRVSDTDIWEIKDAKLKCISLCKTPNCDIYIEPIKFNA